MNAFRRALPPVLLAAAALAFVAAFARSQACPMQAPPQPLRTLYKASERVVVARVGAREVLTQEEEIASVRFALDVSEVVKGPTDRRVLHLYLDEYVGEGAPDADGKDENGAMVLSNSGRPAPRLKRGERYLFFLEPRKEGGFEVNDEGYGIKRLSDEDLKVYLERMKELADITRQEPEERHALLEWIVRCAEHPATRWEGAYELVVSDAAAQAQREQAAGAAQQKGEAEAAQGQAVEETSIAQAQDEAQAEAQDVAEAQSPDAPDAPVTSATIEELPISAASFAPYRYMLPDPELAPMLNAVQKQRLADALFASTEPSEADDLLMRLVKDFGDPRFPAFVLARLHRFEEEPPFEAEYWLTALAASLKNEQLEELARSYARDTTYFEEEEEEEEEKTEAESQAEAAAEADDDESEEEEEVSDEPEETAAEREAREARVKASAERAARKRSAMLKAILARADLFVATGRLAPAEVVSKNDER